MIRNIYLTVAAFALATSSINAKTITPQQALDLAMSQEGITLNNSSRIKTASANGSSMELAYTATSNNAPTIYLFNNTSGEGFVFVAADDAVDQPILAYSDNEYIDMENAPMALQAWVNDCSEQIAQASATAADYGIDNSDEYADIEPLLNTLWGQTSPYNRYTPVENGKNTPAGCVATAMAQCMQLHRWPEQPRGTVSYSTTIGGVRQSLKIGFDTISFNFDLMPGNYHLGYNAAQANEVSKLMMSAGYAVKMQYSTNASSASLLNAAKALVQYFDYAPSTTYLERDYYTYAQWKDIIYNELSEGRPVIYSGQSDSDGHAFVCDGYRNGDYYHINWGWDGACNGYFRMGAMNPDIERHALATKGYNNSHSMIIGIAPSYTGLDAAINLRFSGNFIATTTSVSRTSTASFRCENGAFSMGYNKAAGKLGVRLEDENGNISYIEGETSYTFKYLSATQNIKVAGSKFPTSGTYKVSPAFCDSIGGWHDIIAPLTKKDHVNLTASSSTLKFTTSTDESVLDFSDFGLNSHLVNNHKFAVSAAITNLGKEFFNELRPLLLRNDSIVGYGPGLDVSIPEFETVDFSWVGIMKPITGKQLGAGDYKLVIATTIDSKYKILSPEIDVHMRAASEDATIASTSKAKIINHSNSRAYGSSDEITCQFDIECKQGYFGQNVFLSMTPVNGNNTKATSSLVFVGILSGEATTVTASIPTESLEEGTTYKIVPCGAVSGELTSEATYYTLGATGTTAIESIESAANALSLSVNPVVDNTRLNAPADITSIEIYSMNGALQYAPADIYGASADINASNLASGIYLVKVTTADAKTATVRMIKK